MAAKLVVPDFAELNARLERARTSLARCARQSVERDRERLLRTRERLRRAPALMLERRRNTLEHAGGRLRALSPRSTLARGYAIVRTGDAIVRSSTALAAGAAVDVELAEGGFVGRVEETR